MAIDQKTIETPEAARGQRKVRLGTVISDKMNKTVIVQVGTSKAHRLYRKTVQRRTKFKVHDEKNECGVGDLVRITETNPISTNIRSPALAKTKHPKYPPTTPAPPCRPTDQ